MKLMKKIMFVCKKNSCRSQIAEGFAKVLGKDKIIVNSCGLEASKIHPIAIKVMQEIGIDLNAQKSQSLAEFNPEDYDIVISLCGCGINLPSEWVLREIFEDWQIEDPDGKDLDTFKRVREEIKQRVQLLINQL